MFDDVAPVTTSPTTCCRSGRTDAGGVRWSTLSKHAWGRVLDLAAGTGTSSEPFADAGVFVVPCDFSLGMLRVGKRRRRDLPFVAGDALRLPFADASFDAVTVSFGLRNLNDIEAGLGEMLRVTRPGGRLVVCEFSHPTWAPFRTVYVEYLMRALPTPADGYRAAPRPMSISRSPFGPGPTSAPRRPDRRRRLVRRPVARPVRGSSRCTTPTVLPVVVRSPFLRAAMHGGHHQANPYFTRLTGLVMYPQGW